MQTKGQLMKSLNTAFSFAPPSILSLTISAYDTFATNYFQTYYDIIDAYVKFLRQNVSTDYQATETANTNLADAFK